MKSLRLAGLSFCALALVSKGGAQEKSAEAEYLKYAASKARFVDVQKEEILRFEADVTGDGLKEVFLSKNSLRDGKQGYLWTIYSQSSEGLKMIGDATFSPEVFAPSRWNKDNRTTGFYIYGRGGAGGGVMGFYAVDKGGLKLLEQREVQITGADREEFEKLFGNGTLDAKAPIEVQRKPVLVESSANAEAVSADVDQASQAKNAETRSSITPVPSVVATAAESALPDQDRRSLLMWSGLASLLGAVVFLIWFLRRRK